jgi:hypothetical protein
LLCKKIEINLVIAILEEDGLAPITSLRDMMRTSRYHDPSQTSHAENLTRFQRTAKWE